jgi:predicted NUDIX family NTP pyrophosphohydrolase
MPRQSAGILLFRLTGKSPEFLLVHPGGPFWAKKDIHSWSVPKGEVDEGEEYEAAAKREFMEETGTLPEGELIPLTPVQQKGGKIVYCFACNCDIDPLSIRSNSFEIEWPPRSGKKQSFPEIDRAAWFDASTAREKIIEAQAAFIDEILQEIRQ